MIEFKSGDLLHEDVEALVNTVNCVGVMGRGIALQFKKAFPANFKAYAAACRAQAVQPGRMFVHATGQMTNPRYIINFPTKRHWRGKSRLSDIEAGLDSLVHEIRRLGLRSLALPPLGSGLGGLSWPEVRELIVRVLSPLEDVRVVVFEPRGAPAVDRLVRSSKVPEMTPGRATLVQLMHRYLAGLMDPFVTLLEVHKLMYFMQEAGHHEARARFDRVSRLVDGFETPFGLELLATVHWVASRDGVRTSEEVIGKTHQWAARKRQFSEHQIRVALQALRSESWLPADMTS